MAPAESPNPISNNILVKAEDAAETVELVKQLFVDNYEEKFLLKQYDH